MIKKLFILFVFAIILSGCEATYRLDLDYNTIKEEIELVDDNNKLNGDINIYLDEILESLADTSTETSSYLGEKIIGESKSGVILKNAFSPIGSYRLYSPWLYSCFTNYSVTRGINSLELNSGSTFLCFDDYPELEKLTIEINTKYEVISHNANSVNGNIYRWNITEDNNNNIEIQINNKLNNPNWFDIVNSNVSFQILFLIVAIGTIPSIIIYIAYLRYKKINEV